MGVEKFVLERQRMPKLITSRSAGGPQGGKRNTLLKVSELGQAALSSAVVVALSLSRGSDLKQRGYQASTEDPPLFSGHEAECLRIMRDHAIESRYWRGRWIAGTNVEVFEGEIFMNHRQEGVTRVESGMRSFVSRFLGEEFPEGKLLEIGINPAQCELSL